MAYCPICGFFWLVKTGRKVKRTILGRSANDVSMPPDMICPECERPEPAEVPNV